MKNQSKRKTNKETFNNKNQFKFLNDSNVKSFPS